MYALVPITWRDRGITGEEDISNHSSVESGSAVPCIRYKFTFAFPYIQLVLQLLLNIEYIKLYSDEKADLKKVGVGPRTDDDIPKNASSIRDIEQSSKKTLTQRTMNALWMLLLLQLANICSDSARG